MAALKATPSARAQLGLADSLYQSGRLGEAFEAYTEAQRTYGAQLAGADKARLVSRLKELTGKTGWLSLRLAEAGAEVSVDGKSLGTSPVPALIRVAVGPHEVAIAKAGFKPFAAHVDVVADQSAVVAATLEAQPTTAHLVVHTKGTEPLRVLVDDVDVGATPWEGDVPAGLHKVEGRSSLASAAAQDRADAGRFDLETIDLGAMSTAAHIQVRTNDGKGAIYVDAVARGEGTYVGDLTPGPHVIVVTREGYERFEKTVALEERQTWAETVTLQPLASTVSQSSGAVARAYEGVYGGFGLMGAFGVGGMGTTLQTDCSTLGASSCDTPNANGGGVFGYVGWTWNPVGFELFLAANGDTTKQVAHFRRPEQLGHVAAVAAPAKTNRSPSFAPGAWRPARKRGCRFRTRRVRGTLAGGVGFAYRELFMEREAVTTDGTNRSDKFVPNPTGYFSPALTAEGAIHIRVSPTLAIAVGLEMLADNASMGGSTTGGPEPGHTVAAPNQTPAPIPTPQYHFASGPQVFLGPFLGMQFGP